MNNKIYTFPKPIVSFMQGYTFGGGVGIGCHGSHRIVGETTQIAMPECSIGLVPDVGGSYILAKAPGRLGEYLGTTGARMDADDAIYAGFADTYITHEKWPAVIASLEQDGDLAAIDAALTIPVTGPLRGQNKEIDRLFDVVTLDELLTHLRADRSRFAADTLEKIAGSSPLSMACCIDIIARLRGGGPSLQQALGLEYRFTYRASEHGDLLEGIRAAMIDKDHTPEWQFADMNVPESKVAEMLLPLGDNTLKLEENP